MMTEHPTTSLSARFEPFDSFWEAPADIEKGYTTFNRFYRRNYLKQVVPRPGDQVLVVSCGPGYFVDLLGEMGVQNVLGIDSDPEKVALAVKRGLHCRVEHGFDFLADNDTVYDMIIAEQELNHLTKKEMCDFVALCHHRLSPGGRLVVHSLNGANPITGAEALAQNFDHFNTLTEYSLRQLLEHGGFERVTVFPLKLYVFYENPLNCIGLAADALLQIIFRILFTFYGKSNRIFTKKIAAIAHRAA